ncbi:hypothetical protein L7F22_042911 [Adiantum nelumboides]|nr:hypothetical protein [Adiantum nelumboides]
MSQRKGKEGEMRGRIGSSKGEEEVGKEEGSYNKEDDTHVADSDLEDLLLFEISSALKKESSSMHDYVTNTLGLTDGMDYDARLQILKQATEEWRKTAHIDKHRADMMHTCQYLHWFI